MMNAIEHALIVCDGELTRRDLPIDMLSGEASPAADDSLDLRSVERNHIIRVLHFTHGNKTKRHGCGKSGSPRSIARLRNME